MLKFLSRIGSSLATRISQVLSRVSGKRARASENATTSESPLSSPRMTEREPRAFQHTPDSEATRPSPKTTGDSLLTCENVTVDHGDVIVVTGDAHVHRQQTINSVTNYFQVPITGSSGTSSPTDGEILDWLSNTNFRERHLKNLAARAPETCNDFLTSLPVQEWLKRKFKTLVGVGIPGAGKSVLASALVEHINREKPSQLGQRYLAMYIFCDAKEDLSVTSLLLALLRQVLERHKEDMQPARELYMLSRCELTPPNEESVAAALIKICDNFETVYLIVDGLHEARNAVQHRLLEVFMHTTISLFITARETDIVATNLRNLQTRYIKLQATNDDIRSFVVKKLESQSEDGKIWDVKLQDVAQTVSNASHGMFLHAELQTQALQLCRNADEFKKNLQGFPEKIEAKHKVILDLLHKDHVPGSFGSRAKEVISWILHAQRSLDVEELQYLLATDPITYIFDDRRVIDEAALVSACCGLVTIKPRGARRIVCLFHPISEPVLRELLEETASQAHQTLACVCIASLKASGAHRWDKDRPFLELPAPRPPYDVSLNFSDYAYNNWAFHARVCPRKQVVEEFLLQCVSYPAKGDLLGPLHVAAFYNLLPSDRLTTQIKLDARTPIDGKTALMLAAGEGHNKAVICLLREPARPKLHQSRGGNHGHPKTIDGNLHAVDRHGRNALMHASKGGHSQVVKTLLHYCNIRLDPVDSKGRNAITLAQAAGHLNVVISLHHAEELQESRRRRWCRPA